MNRNCYVGFSELRISHPVEKRGHGNQFDELGGARCTVGKVCSKGGALARGENSNQKGPNIEPVLASLAHGVHPSSSSAIRNALSPKNTRLRSVVSFTPVDSASSP